MGVRVLKDGESALYDSTTGQAFGPIFESESDAEAFIAFATEQGVMDIRRIGAQLFDRLYAEFLKKNEAFNTAAGE